MRRSIRRPRTAAKFPTIAHEPFCGVKFTFFQHLPRINSRPPHNQLHQALDAIAREGRGVLVYLPQEGRGIGLAQKIRAYALQEQGLDTVEANHALGFKADMRDYGVGIQILKDLGLRRIRLLTNNPKKTEAFNLRGFDLTVTDQVPIISKVNEYNAGYLATKRDKMGHNLP